MANERRRAPVIADVARLAAVSVPTVSRVLTGAARVAPDKRERVLAAIAELNYRPSPAARALVTRRSRMIAVVAGNTSQYGYAETIRGIEEEARADGYTVTITVVESSDDETVDRAISLLLDQGADGIAVLKFDPPGVAMLNKLPENLPVVAISGVRGRSVPQAVLDETSAAESLTEYLLALGHTTVHHVRVPPSRREDGRTTGWRRALKNAGAAVAEPFEASWNPESGRLIGHRIAEDPAITAVFCGNDEIAMGVIKGLTESGRVVPDDVSVVGFDDHPLARMWTPALTTVDQDFGELGRRAFALLRTAMGVATGPKFSSALPTLVLRESAAAPKG
ncbi:LacI family DNA-binding transcriptional regulator [Microbacteriaceae bacterium VKM Ac-2855]|nr:LacI family DNA-binding transcriptional regulator [Microbacteriaceae bacterium VKM Ac-2855]